MKIKAANIFLIVFLLLLINNEALAQCPMCKMAVESNLKNGGSGGLGLNTGILYMLAVPYILVGTIAYLWWKNRKTEQE